VVRGEGLSSVRPKAALRISTDDVGTRRQDVDARSADGARPAELARTHDANAARAHPREERVVDGARALTLALPGVPELADLDVTVLHGAGEA
jgi:hypothetical protein